ncbi:MAG: DUF6777 domain-containing protein [Aquihabitans sp.]
MLQAVGADEIDPFTESVALAKVGKLSADANAAITAALADFEATDDAGRQIPGDTPGLYGGTGEKATCDLDRMADYLGDEANASKAEAFAGPLGIEADEIPETLEGYTSVVLTTDTFVTNHGFRDGKANPFGAVLEAGTAVAVDDHGVPRVKCGCGNPLDAAPSGIVIDENTPTSGEPWAGWNPGEVVIMTPSGEAVGAFVVIDVDTGENTTIPVGGNLEAPDPDDCVVDADGHGPDCPPAQTTPTTPPSSEPTTTTPSSPPVDDSPDADRSWGNTAGGLGIGDERQFGCAPGGRLHEVFGVGPYEESSSVCSAAVHAGLITLEAGGMVSARGVMPPGPLPGGSANGVTTAPSGNPRGAFEFV